MDKDRFEPCYKCNGYVDTHGEHCTAEVSGRKIHLHRDFCVEYVEVTLHNLRFHRSKAYARQVALLR